jgi:hypothetical protein
MVSCRVEGEPSLHPAYIPTNSLNVFYYHFVFLLDASLAIAEIIGIGYTRSNQCGASSTIKVLGVPRNYGTYEIL